MDRPGASLLRDRPSGTCASCSPRTRRAASGSTAEAAGLYLDYSKNRITDETVRLLIELAERVRAAGAASTRCFAASTSTSPRTARCCTSRCACRASARWWSTASTSSRRSTRCSTGWRAFAERVRCGAWTGHTGKPIRNVVNIGIGGSDLGPVMAYEALRHYSAPRPDLPIRLQRRRDGLRRGHARPRPRGDAVHRLVEDVHDARDDDQRAHRARRGRWPRCGDEAAVAKHFVAVSTNAEEVAEFGIDTDEHVRVLGLGRRPLLDGLGDRPLDDDRHRARPLPRDARRLPRDGRALPHRAVRARTCRC